jgi:hypothetical protein
MLIKICFVFLVKTSRQDFQTLGKSPMPSEITSSSQEHESLHFCFYEVISAVMKAIFAFKVAKFAIMEAIFAFMEAIFAFKKAIFAIMVAIFVFKEAIFCF